MKRNVTAARGLGGLRTRQSCFFALPFAGFASFQSLDATPGSLTNAVMKLQALYSTRQGKRVGNSAFFSSPAFLPHAGQGCRSSTTYLSSVGIAASSSSPGSGSGAPSGYASSR